MTASTTDDRRRHPRRRRSFGWLLVIVGIIGILAAAVGAVAGTAFVNRIDDDLEASTTVTVEAIEVAQDSVDVFGSVLDTVRTQTGDIAVALRNTADVVERTREVLDTTTQLTTEEVPDLLTSLADAFPALETSAAAIDTVINAVSELPIVPDYDPETPLDEAVAGLGDDLDDLSTEIRNAGERIAEANEAAASSPGDLRDVATTIEELDAEFDTTEALVDEYETTLTDARDVAVDALENAQDGTAWAVPVIIALAVAFSLGQIATIWLGLRLRSGADLVDIDTE